MRDPEPKNPSSTLPPKGSNEFIKPKRSTRNSIAKPSVNTGMKVSRKVSFKAGKGNVSLKDIDGLVNDEDVSNGGVIRDEVTEKEIQASLEKEMADVMGEIANNTGNVSKPVGSVNVNNSSLGPMPVPFEENDILNPRKSFVTSPRILKRGEPLNDGGHNANATFSFNNVKKWPSLGNLGARRSGVYGGQDSGISDEVMGENVDVRRTSSFVNAVQGMRSLGNNMLKRIPVTTNELGKKVVNLDPVLEEGSKAWVRNFVGYFVGLKMSHKEILGHLRRMWRAYNLDEVIMNDSGLYFLKFKVEEAGMCMSKPEPTRVPLWVKIFDIPLEAWNSDGSSRIASMIGNPIIMDRITTSMCENAYGRASFARVLIEVDANDRLVDSIEACYNNLGRSMMLRVEYPWKPPICSHYKVFGHGFDKCSKRDLTDAKKMKKSEVNTQSNANVSNVEKSGAEWQTVNNRRYNRNDGMNGNFYGQRNSYGEGSSRGGFGGRGRGMGGRGYGDQRYDRNENAQYVQVKKVNVASKTNVQGNKDNGKLKSDVNASNSKDKKKVVNEGMDIDGSSNGMSNTKKGIDEACEKGLHINVEEKNNWSSDLWDYFKFKMQELVKKQSIDDLELRIKNLERQVNRSTKMIAMESCDKANVMMKSVMIEQGLTQNQAYGKVYRDELNRIKEMSLKLQLAEVELFFKTGNEDMVEEVAEDRSASAQFIVQDVISNVVNSDFNQEQDLRKKFVNKVCDEVFGAWDWVSNTADSLTTRARLKLWDNLVDHKELAGNDPWVLLGDFNVILRVNENSSGLAVRDNGMKEFRGCVERLEIEDINMNGFSYTWIQKRKCHESGILKKLDRVICNSHFVTSYPSSFATFLPYISSDHCSAVLTLPEISVRRPRSFRFMNFLADKKEFLGVVKDNWEIGVKGFDMFKLAKKLKAMKKHIRSLNRRNGNVFEKVKVLKAELSKIQEELDRDPSNADLREEEMIYYHAYKEAALDEEKLLQQKTKIQWLREGDFNSAFFHNSVKGRTSRNRIEMIYDAQGNAIYGDSIANILFLKKLDMDKAIDLIRRVADNEIKAALFNIDDNKVAGPDGYSSKFFKAAWSIIGKDIRSATKEFFSSGKMLGEFNTTLISLVPKLKSPARVTDYRPISCCNVIYKIIIRQISDNILLAQEFMFGYHSSKIAKNCAFKIDVQKAYDTVSWDFLEFCLREFGFHQVMVHWIMTCLKTASFSVNDKRFRYHFRCGKLMITSLCFADDLLMLCHGDMIYASILRRGLDEFSMFSGLYPSEAKSEAFFFGLTPEVKEEIKLVMPFIEGTLPIRYLCVPLSSKNINKNDCRVLVEAVQNKVSDWRNKCLSFAGKLQLIASILSSLHVYWSSLFFIPAFICDAIDKIIKNFLWTKGGNATGKVSVCWKDVCKPKSQGGLGLRSLHDWNEALMAKHLWSIASNKDSIWVKWVKIYKLRGNNLWDLELKKGNSWVWLQLLRLKDKIDKKGRERNFKVSEVWKAVRTDSPGVIWYKHVWFSQCIPKHSFITWMAIKGRLKTRDRLSRWFVVPDLECLLCRSENESHSHLFFPCAYSKRLWERLKPMALMENMSNVWPSVISSIVNKTAYNTIWSVIQRLVFGAAIYSLWLERNSRIYNQVDRTVDSIFEQVVSTVRLKLRGLVFKNPPDVLKASEIWDFLIEKGSGSSNWLILKDRRLNLAAWVFEIRSQEYCCGMTTKEWGAQLITKGDIGEAATTCEWFQIRVSQCGFSLRVRICGFRPIDASIRGWQGSMVSFLYKESQQMAGDLWTNENRGLVFVKCVEANLFRVEFFSIVRLACRAVNAFQFC
ncbi:putative RNA-directed DNA polymerase [Tanacetum coccineum]